MSDPNLQKKNSLQKMLVEASKNPEFIIYLLGLCMMAIRGFFWASVVWLVLSLTEHGLESSEFTFAAIIFVFMFVVYRFFISAYKKSAKDLREHGVPDPEK